jgi:small subunit ribosomal protein S1
MDSDHTGRDALQDEEIRGPAPAADASSSMAEASGASENGESGMEALLRDQDYSFKSVRRGETVEGTVVRVDQDEVLVDIGLKSEGLIPARELFSEDEEADELHVGDKVLVYVMHPEGQEGHAILSLRRAQAERSWRDIDELHRRGEVVEAPVVDFNKGGLIVDLKGVRGFVPVSQVLDLRNVTRPDGENEEVNQSLVAMKGRRLPLKIIEINRSRNRLILSERAAVQERRTQLKDELMDQLEPGQIRKGVVSNLTSFGAFVDLGGADGLIHVSELSYNRVNHPSELVQVSQEVDVFVLSVDKDTRKIALSLKRAQPDPWTTVDERYRVGQVVPATITKLAKFGAFAKVEEGLEGLIHLSELTDLPVQDATQIVREGQQVDVKIIHINSQRRRLGLSVRQTAEPQGQFESYGEVDENTPFATDELRSYETTDSDSIETEPATESPIDLAPTASMEEQAEGHAAVTETEAVAITPEQEVPGGPVGVTEPHPTEEPTVAAENEQPESETAVASTSSEPVATMEENEVSEQPAGEDTLIAESEPESVTAGANGSTAATPEEAPPASPGASLSHDEEAPAEVASVAHKGTSTE